MPIPVIETCNGSDKLCLIDSKYYHNLEPDNLIAEKLNLELIKNQYYYEGGNFLADKKGNCFFINWNSTGSPYLGNANDQYLPMRSNTQEIMKEKFGCKNVFPLPYVSGIGHVDERIKILSDEIAVTDTNEYIQLLQGLGYKVYSLPKMPDYDTYVNSLQVNGTIFLPTFNKPEDKLAIQVYESLGFKVIPINSCALSEIDGNIHCTTMCYPGTCPQ